MTDDHRNDADDLARRIADAKAKAGGPVRTAPTESSRGYAVATQFVGAMLAGGLLGWFIDRWFGTAPWAMIVCLGLGFAAGTRSVLRSAKQFDGTPGE